MSYNKLLHKAQRNNVLFNVLLELTYTCNHRCAFCYNDKSPHSGTTQLNLNQYLLLLAELSSLGVMHLTLSGGEPLLSPYFWEIGRVAKKGGFAVRIKSNGYGIDKQMAHRIKREIAPFNIDLSLHGATAATHDRQTGVAGSFDRLLENIEAMQVAGLRLSLNSPFTAWNEDEIEEMHLLADKLGIPLLIDDRITPKDNGDRSPLQLLSTPHGLKRLAEIRLARHAAQRERSENPAVDARKETKTEDSLAHHCSCGLASLVIDPFGTVFPCVQWRKPLGSIHEESLTQIWQSSAPLKQIRKATANVKKYLQQFGPEIKKGGFCPAIAEQMGGEATVLDYVTLRRLELLNVKENEQ